MNEGLPKSNGLQDLLECSYILIGINQKDDLIALGDSCFQFFQEVGIEQVTWTSFNILGVKIILMLRVDCQGPLAWAWTVGANDPECNIAVTMVSSPHPLTQSHQVGA
jgi:hypothetical protein